MKTSNQFDLLKKYLVPRLRLPNLFIISPGDPKMMLVSASLHLPPPPEKKTIFIQYHYTQYWFYFTHCYCCWLLWKCTKWTKNTCVATTVLSDTTLSIVPHGEGTSKYGIRFLGYGVTVLRTCRNPGPVTSLVIHCSHQAHFTLCRPT